MSKKHKAIFLTPQQLIPRSVKHKPMTRRASLNHIHGENANPPVILHPKAWTQRAPDSCGHSLQPKRGLCSICEFPPGTIERVRPKLVIEPVTNKTLVGWTREDEPEDAE